MIYSREEMMIFSLIYSDLREGRYPTPHINHKILYIIFFYSIEKNINFLELENINEKKLFFKEILDIAKEKYSLRSLEKYFFDLEEYFIKKNKIQELKLKAKKEFNLCNEYKIFYKSFFDVDYPENLKQLLDPPFMIFYKGYLPSNRELEKSLAIIGTRFPEEKYGKEIANRIGKFLYSNKWWNISGLAVGCDEYGHKGSMGLTGAILGHGLCQKIYPKENINLAEEILTKNGFLLSELPPSTKLQSLFLILRDRLQSGISQGIFVVETSEKSGTLHTVKYSLEQNKLTFIWNINKIKELREKKELRGNQILLGYLKEELYPSIPKKLMAKIISIENVAQLNIKLEENELLISQKNKQQQNNVLTYKQESLW